MKPSIPKGTRDFSPTEVANRTYIMNTIKRSFETFGFQPIETPSFENSSTLMGKYGEEGDRLIFKILNSGDFLEKYFHITHSFINDLFKELKDNAKNFVIENKFQDVGLYKDKVFTKTLNKVKEVITNNLEGENLKLGTKIISQQLIKDVLYEALKPETISDFVYSDDKFIKDLSEKLFIRHLLNLESNSFTKSISEKALRYDLTVPFARYVVQHQNDITFPFKRYQVQPVWRADRPQKGRFREFFQCDADVVGSKSLWQEVEFIQLYDTVFTKLGLAGTTIKINNRKILSGIAEVIGAQDKLIDFTVALDKLDKIGEEKVKEEMRSKGISEEGISKLQPLFSLSGNFESQIESLKGILNTSEEGQKGIEELDFINTAITELGLSTATLQLDVTLARGLNYYTGAIFEVAAPEGVKMGSIGGGGRYDDLTGIFGMKNVSGVGISFGLDRIYLVLEELGLFPETVNKTVEVLFINFGDKEALFSLKAIKELRFKGVNAELYPDAAKMKKQMNHANKRNIPFVVLVGDQEIESNTYTLKNMISGEQDKVSLNALVLKIKKS